MIRRVTLSVITDEILERYSDENYQAEPDDGRPVLIDPGLYPATMVDWSAGFNPMYKKAVLTMRFQIGNEMILGWFTIQSSNATTTVKAGWKSNFLRMYQECFDIRLPRRDRIPMSRFNDAKLEVNRPQFARHLSVIQNDYDRGDYEQKAIPR
jgi:hypothetical protein